MKIRLAVRKGNYAAYVKINIPDHFLAGITEHGWVAATNAVI
jgi:hypothetical protein